MRIVVLFCETDEICKARPRLTWNWWMPEKAQDEEQIVEAWTTCSIIIHELPSGCVLETDDSPEVSMSTWWTW